MAWQPTRFEPDELRRVREYDYDEWLRTGWRLLDYDFETQEYILAPLEPNPMSRREAGGHE